MASILYLLCLPEVRIRKRASEKRSASLCGSLAARNIRSSTVGYTEVKEKRRQSLPGLGRLSTGVLLVRSR